MPGRLSRSLAAVAVTSCLSLQPLAASAADMRDGSHDFDFLIGDWKAHVRILPDRLVGSNQWVEYDGISNHKKLLDSNANFEEFDVYSAALQKRKRRRRCGCTIPRRASGRST